jgi:hypothetical protein
MFIEFDNEFQSYDEGNLKPFLKEDEPFEVSAQEAERLLEIKGARRSDQGKISRVSVFRKVQVKESVLPEDFPHRKELEENKIFGFEQLSALGREGIYALDGIGNVKTDAIMAAIEQYKENNQ